MKPFTGRHTGEKIFDETAKVLNEYKINDRVFMAVHDNGSNVVNATKISLAGTQASTQAEVDSDADDDERNLNQNYNSHLAEHLAEHLDVNDVEDTDIEGEIEAL